MLPYFIIDSDTMASNSSLLETLKELENLSRVDVQDPEDEDFEGGRVSTFRDDDDEAGDDNTKNLFGNMRKKVTEAVEVKYAGEKSSRKDLMGWSDEDDDTDGEDEDEDEGIDNLEDDDDGDEDDIEGGEDDIEGGDDDDDDQEDIEDEEDEVVATNAEEGPDTADNDDKDGDENDASDMDDDDESDDNTMNIDFSKLPADLQNSVMGNQPKDNDDDEDNDDDPLAHFTKSRDDNVKKGEATKSQLDILDKLLESRIRVQKSLHVCNQLPQHDTMQGFRDEATPQVKEAYESAKSSMKELLNKLLALQDKICDSNTETSALLTTGNVTSSDPGDEEIPSDTEDEDEDVDKKEEKTTEQKNELNLPSKRKHTLTVSEYGEEVVKRHKAFQSFQETTINKWHEKTRLASSVSSKNFASFDKSVTQQIKQVLADKERLVKRTQLSRVPLNVLGKKNDDTETEESNNGDCADLHLKNYDENIFDDGDFYHEMLKELIERKSNIDADDPVAAGRRWLELQKLRTKIKRKVDTRASKGRKVRYDVHTKLVSFMAPQNVGTMGDQARNNLFATLFGQKPSVCFGA